MDDIYSPPKSDVVKRSREDYGNIYVFKRFSAWFVFIFSIVTLGIYVPYWLYTRTTKLNRISHSKISDLFIWSTTSLYVFTWVIIFSPLFFEFLDSYIGPSQPHMTYFPFIELLSNILILVWVFKFRNRLDEMFSNASFNLGIILTFFFQIIYLQYKINELIDNEHNKR